MALSLGILTLLGSLWLLWYLYIIVIGLYRAHLDKKLTKAGYLLGGPALLVGWTLDWSVNLIIASIWFIDPPRSPFELLTGRLSRYIKSGNKRQMHQAKIICKHLLDLFDPNPRGHCI